jgi:hypothetical protein
LLTPSGVTIFTTANAVAIAMYLGSGNWAIVNYENMLSTGSGTVQALGSISGLIPSSIAGTNSTATLTTSAGAATDSTGNAIVALSSPLAWAVSNGNAINGYSGGTTLPNSTSIHFFICQGSSGTGVFASNSLTPSFPTGYATYTRRIYSILTTAAGAFIPFTAVEIYGGAMRAYLTTQTTDINGTLSTANRTLSVMNVPTGIKVGWLGRSSVSTAPGVTFEWIITSGDEPDVAPSTAAFYDVGGGNNAGAPAFSGMKTTNTSGQIGVRGTAAQSYIVSTYGWDDFRRN